MPAGHAQKALLPLVGNSSSPRLNDEMPAAPAQKAYLGEHIRIVGFQGGDGIDVLAWTGGASADGYASESRALRNRVSKCAPT